MIIATAAALRGVTIQSARARAGAAFPTTRTFPRLPTPLNSAAAAAVGQLHGYTPYVFHLIFLSLTFYSFCDLWIHA
jgi:hypothetical protein